MAPNISNDGLRLYYTNTSSKIGKTGIYQARRVNLESKFSNPKFVCELPEEFNGIPSHDFTLTNKEDTLYINTYTSNYNKVFAYSRTLITKPFSNKMTIDLVGSGVYSAKISYVENTNSIVVLSADDGLDGYYNPVMKVFKRETPTRYAFVKKIDPFDSIQMKVFKNGVSWIGRGKKSKKTYKICSDPDMTNFQIGGRIEMPLKEQNLVSSITSMNSCFSVFSITATFYADFAYSSDVLTYTVSEFCNVDSGPTITSVNPVIIPEPEIPNLVIQSGSPANRKFSIKNVTKGEITNFELFNRWGKSVFVEEVYSMDWPKESKAPGIYFYSFLYQSRKYQGWVTVQE